MVSVGEKVSHAAFKAFGICAFVVDVNYFIKVQFNFFPCSLRLTQTRDRIDIPVVYRVKIPISRDNMKKLFNNKVITGKTNFVVVCEQLTKS